MKRILNSFMEKVTVKKALIATVVFLVMLWLIDYSPIGVAGLLKVSNGVGILDFETRYTVEYAYNWLESMGEAGRAFHLTKVMPLDIFFPPSLMLFMLTWLGLLLKRNTVKDSNVRYLAGLPVVYLLLDYLENIGITAMLINYPNQLRCTCVTTGWVTSVKKTVVLLIILLFIIQLIVFLVKSIMKKADTRIKDNPKKTISD